MSEAMARAVGAGSPLTVEIDGKQCTVRPLSIRELTEVERDCVERYRRSYLKTFADNLDLVPKNIRESMMREKFEEAARWDVDDLPRKEAFSSVKVKVTKGLRRFIKAEYTETTEPDDDKIQLLAAAALDSGMLSVEQYKSLTGEDAKPTKVPYVAWWITGSTEGKITFIWMTFRHNDVTREQVADAVSENIALFTEVAQEIERLSSPQLGNG